MLRRLAASLTVLVAVAAVSAACGGDPGGRVDPGAESAGADGGPIPVQTPTTEPSETTTTEAPGRQAANRNNICRGRAGSFLPDAVDGYAVVGSGDATGLIPPGVNGINSAAAAALRRGADQSQALVTVVLFDESMATSPMVQAGIDLLVNAVGGEAGMVDANVNGYEARIGVGKDGGTILLWQECLNVFVLVQSQAEATARDLAAKVHTP